MKSQDSQGNYKKSGKMCICPKNNALVNDKYECSIYILICLYDSGVKYNPDIP